MIKHKNEENIAQRIVPIKLTQKQLLEYAGAYYSEELETTYTITMRDSVLIMQHQRHPDYTLQAETVDTFNGVDLFSRIVFERNQEKQITGFRLNSGRVRNLWFIKN